MNKNEKKTIKLGAVQMVSKAGNIKGNLEHAASFVKEASNAGVQLLLFPELMPSGYTLNPLIWEAGETAQGTTVNWLLETAKTCGMYIGTSFIEVEGSHFYNTFVLAGPDGREAGRVRKQHAETYFFRGARDVQHFVETDLGRIGVGICADNQYSNLLPELQQAGVNLHLMPHAWPAPFRVVKNVSREDIQRQQKLAGGMAVFYAGQLGVPAVFCNQTGPVSGQRGVGLVGSAMNSPDFYLAGLSGIADSDGKLLAQAGREEKLLAAEVHLDPRMKKRTYSVFNKKWVFPGSPIRDVLFGFDGFLGSLYYTFSRRRKELARRL